MGIRSEERNVLGSKKSLIPYFLITICSFFEVLTSSKWEPFPDDDDDFDDFGGESDGIGYGED